MCQRWMFSCGEVLTDGQDRQADLLNLYLEGCRECSDWAWVEMNDDKKVPQQQEQANG